MELNEQIKNYIVTEIERGIKKYPVNSNWPSSLGHPCLRFLVMRRLFWNEEERHGVELQSIFDEGNEQHDAFSRWLKNHGVTITMEEVPFPDKGFQISGKIDGYCKFPFMDKPLPYEFKSMSNYAHQKVNTWDDIKNSSYMYTRNYAAQFNTYLYLSENEQGIFFMKNKEKGMASIKPLIVTLDYALAEETLKKCEDIIGHLSQFKEVEGKKGKEEAFKTLPDYLSDANICSRCPQRGVCNPPLPRVEADIVLDEGTTERFGRFMDLKNAIKEYNALESEFKEKLKGKTSIIGKWMATGKWIETKERTTVYKANKYWKPKYTALEEGSSEEE